MPVLRATERAAKENPTLADRFRRIGDYFNDPVFNVPNGWSTPADRAK